MKPCRSCGGPARGDMRVLVDDGAVLPGRLRDRRLGPQKRRVPNSALCRPCFLAADEEFKVCKAEHEALVAGGMTAEQATEEMLRRFAAPKSEAFDGIDRGVDPQALAGWKTIPPKPFAVEDAVELMDRLWGPRRPGPEAA